MTNILIIGSGAREHIIAKKLAASATSPSLFCWASNKNPGLLSLCKDLQTGSLTESNAIVHYAKSQHIDFAIIGPELPLSVGVADALEQANIPCIGPKKALAKIESSKAFTRTLTTKYKIPGNPAYFHFKNRNGIIETLQQLSDAYVIKANGLMGGKGVKLSGEHLHSHMEALQFCDEIFAAGQEVVIEEKLVGEEFSLLSFVAGNQIIHLPAVQDHKRAFTNDTGPNTGGMGSYSDHNFSLPFLQQSDIEQARKINELTAKALQQECGEIYRGVLYGSYILTHDGVKLIEFNARFGDPEAINLLSLLSTDFALICQAMLNQTLDQLEINFKPQATVCKYLVPNGYPNQAEKGQPIAINKLPKDVDCYFGAIEQTGDQHIMTGSRAIALVSQGNSIEQASEQVEQAIAFIQGNFFHRPDIGTHELINKRITHMKQLRQAQLA